MKSSVKGCGHFLLSNTYQKNIKTVKQEILRIIASEAYAKLPAKQQIICNYILTTILASEHSYCDYSNRTIAEKCGTSLTPINKVRLWLEQCGFCVIIPLKNGKRANPRYRLELADAQTFSYKSHQSRSKAREAYLKELDFKFEDLKLMDTSLLCDLGKLGTLVAEKQLSGKSLSELLSAKDVFLKPAKSLSSKSKVGNSGVGLLDSMVSSSNSGFNHSLLSMFDKYLVESKFWQVLEQAAGCEANGFKVGGCQRNEGTSVWKGQLRKSGKVLRRMSKYQRLEDLYLCFVAASSDSLLDFAEKTGNGRLFMLADDVSESGFNYMIRRRQEILFENRQKVNGFAVLCPKDVVVIDCDHPLVSKDLLECLQEGFVQASPSGNGRFHGYIKDSDRLLHQFNIHHGFEVLGGNKQVFFQALDKDGSLLYPTICGSLNSIGNLSPQIEKLFDLKFTYREWYGKENLGCGAKLDEILVVGQNLKHLEIINANPDYWYTLNNGEKLYFENEKLLKAFENKLRKAEKRVKTSLRLIQVPVQKGENLKLFADFKLPEKNEKYDRTYYNGERNKSLFKYGRYLRCRGFNEKSISESLIKANYERCQTPLLERELGHIIKSIIRLDNTDGFVQHIPLFSRKMNLYV